MLFLLLRFFPCFLTYLIARLFLFCRFFFIIFSLTYTSSSVVPPLQFFPLFSHAFDLSFILIILVLLYHNLITLNHFLLLFLLWRFYLHFLTYLISHSFSRSLSCPCLLSSPPPYLLFSFLASSFDHSLAFFPILTCIHSHFYLFFPVSFFLLKIGTTENCFSLFDLPKGPILLPPVFVFILTFTQ